MTGIANGDICPIMCCSAIKEQGIKEVLDNCIKYVPKASGSVKSKRRQCLQVDLREWEHCNAVTKIQILLKRGSGEWKSGAGIVVEKIGFR